MSSGIGKGTTISYDAGSSGPTLLAEVVNCGLPISKVGKVDGTHYTSPNNLVVNKSVQWIEQDDISLTLNLTLEQYQDAQEILGAEGVEFVITIPEVGMKFTFTGFLSSLGGGDIPNKDMVRLPAAITPQSLIVAAAA